MGSSSTHKWSTRGSTRGTYTARGSPRYGYTGGVGGGPGFSEFRQTQGGFRGKPIYRRERGGDGVGGRGSLGIGLGVAVMSVAAFTAILGAEVSRGGKNQGKNFEEVVKEPERRPISVGGKYGVRRRRRSVKSTGVGGTENPEFKG